MSMTEAPPPAKPKRKKQRKAAKPVAAKPEIVTYPGLTATVCAKACGIGGCAIGTSYCAHPNKGGLQGPDMGDPAKLERLQQARKQLAKDAAEKRFT